jgi:hypothetical protein
MSIVIRPYDIGCEPSPSAPAETLVQDGWSTYLIFWAVSKSCEGKYLRDLGVAVVECERCAVSKFGYPNDEGLPEHVLYAVGLREATSAVLEVEGSSWVEQVVAQQRASSQRIWGGRGMGVASSTSMLRHFIMPLKESTFECLADALSLRHVAKDFEGALAYVSSQLAQH